jgi:arsenical pump membrane protein
MLSNAGSLLLPGSNLTNLIVLGHFRLSGEKFFEHSWAPALVVTAAVVAVAERRHLSGRETALPTAALPHGRLGVLGVLAAAVLVVVLRSPAIAVVAVGAVAVVLRLVTRRIAPGRVLETLGLALLVGLFGLAVGLGTVARVWSGPSMLLSHLDSTETAVLATVRSVAFNNLPAASLLAARTPSHPLAILLGLNIGPNLFVSGSLAWLLWLRAARGAGAQPSIRRAVRLGVFSVPLALAAALAALALTGSP